jgi:ABC-2 type transport system permease protein
VAAQKPVTLTLIVHPDANPADFQATQNLITSASRDLSLENQILAGLRQMGEMQAGSPEFQEAFSSDRLVGQAESQFENSRTHPLVVVQQVSATSSEESQDMGASDWAQASVAGFTVLFVFLAAQGTARSIYDEKRDGSFRRLLAAPIRKPELLSGKLMPNLLLALLQVVVIFGVGILVLPILGWGELTIPDPLSWAVVSVVIALCSTSLGILIASLAHTEAQISGLSTVILWVAGMIGGSFIPTFMMPEFLQTIGRFVPQFWANQAFYDILVRGKELGDVIPGIAVLLVFTAIFFGIGLWRFDFD